MYLILLLSLLFADCLRVWLFICIPFLQAPSDHGHSQPSTPVTQERVILPPRQGTPCHSNKNTKQPLMRTAIHAPPIEPLHTSSLLTSSEEDEDQQLSKWLNWGPDWRIVNTSETLGANQRDFIVALTRVCEQFDVVLAFCLFLLSGDTVKVDNTSLSGPLFPM